MTKFEERGVTSAHVIDLAKAEKPFTVIKVGEHFIYDRVVYQKVELLGKIYAITVETGEPLQFEDKDEVTLVSSYHFGPESFFKVETSDKYSGSAA